MANAFYRRFYLATAYLNDKQTRDRFVGHFVKHGQNLDGTQKSLVINMTASFVPLLQDFL